MRCLSPHFYVQGWLETPDSNGRTVEVETGQIFFKMQGSNGPTIILESGMGSSYLAWERLQNLLDGQYVTVSYSRASYPWSSSTIALRDEDTIVEEFWSFVDAADLEPPYILVGHSLGGALAVFEAIERPDRVAGVIAVDPVPLDFITIAEELIGELELEEDDSQALRSLARPPLIPGPITFLGASGLLKFTGMYKTRGSASYNDYRRHVASTSRFWTTFNSELANVDINKGADFWARFPDIPLVHIRTSMDGFMARIPDALAVVKKPATVARLHQMIVDSYLGLSTRSRYMEANTDSHAIQETDPETIAAAIQWTIEASPYQGTNRR